MHRGEKVRGQNSIHKTKGLTLNKNGVLFEDKLKENRMMLVIWKKTLLGIQQGVYLDLFIWIAVFCILSVNYCGRKREHYSTHFPICQLACPSSFLH